MDNNETTNSAVETAQGGVANTENSATIDYKAEYEKMKKLKDQYSKESAEWKNKYNSTLSEAEQSRLASEEREAYYKDIERKYNMSKISASLSKTISDEDVVNSIASKMLNNDNFGVIEDINKYLSAHDENIRKQENEKLLKNNPTPPPTNTNGNGGITKEQFSKMTYQERLKLKDKDPELYKKLVK